MIDNSISMADKQRLLAESVPVLVQRLIDPICVDVEGNPAGGTNQSGCSPDSPEFAPIEDLHIGIITSSLGNHGGDVCTPDPNEMPPRTLNDAAQLIASVRTGLYSYANQGFLVWDPRVGDDRPVPETHPNLTMREQNAQVFVEDLAGQIGATGERGCGYEASLEAWYRFLVDPEPINQVTVDPTGQFNVRGFINPVVLEQRAAFMRPDSLLAIVMLTDENDCSIDDEEGHQGWLVTKDRPMPRASDACSYPQDPNVYRCCIPCVLAESPGFQPPPGCSYANDVSCNHPDGSSLAPVDDSMGLRCFEQVRRFGMNLLYPWQRYSDALKSPRIALREPDADGNVEVTNPIYTPGIDGTPARDPSRVFLAGIVGVPWQDIATGQSLAGGRELTFLSAQEMTNPPPGTPPGNRWDVILGDPDTGRLPADPFMHETIDPRSGSNPFTGDAIMPPVPGNTGNALNGHEQNIVNRDDLQYACIFDLVPDVACDSTNQAGCDCNEFERAYNRPICQYPDTGDGVQTHAKAYPGVRHLQVLKAFGDNAIVASICPKNTVPDGGGPATDPDYGYNPAVQAIVSQVKTAFQPSCLPRPLSAEEDGRIPCAVVDVTGPGACSCTARPGHLDPSSSLAGTIEDELIASGLCGGGSDRPCSDYCVCEIQQLAGAELEMCQYGLADPGTLHGFCYVAPNAGHGSSDLVAQCPSTQQQTIRFMGDDVPLPNSAAFLVCSSD
jgi:hypothetical protein